jgi:hypothetical protein
MWRCPQQRKRMVSMALALAGRRLEVGFCSGTKGARGARGNAVVGGTTRRRERRVMSCFSCPTVKG